MNKSLLPKYRVTIRLPILIFLLFSTNCKASIHVGLIDSGLAEEDECIPDTQERHPEYARFIQDQNGVIVKVEFWIQGITHVSEVTNDFEMDMYITEIWEDPKLNFEHLNACKSNLSLDQATLQRVWSPNNCFVNSKSAEIHDSPFQNVFFSLFSNGTVWVNFRVSIKGPCSMNLVNFPMDTQACQLNYQSFSYNNDEVRLIWNTQRDPIFTLGTIRLPEFTLRKITPGVIIQEFPAGMWDELVVTLVFERRYVWYILRAYIPTYLTIVISWIAFSLGSEAIASRTMLGVNALLSMIFHFGNIMRNLPRVSYVKAIDVWMLASISFVFLSLVELAIVGFHERKNICHTTVRKIDNFAKMLFPATFSVFNIIYWARYGMKVFTPS